MTTQSWVIIWFFVYLALLVGFTILAKRLNRTRPGNLGVSDFFLSSGFPLGPLLMTFTFGATLMSAFFIVGLPGFIYTHGLGTWPYILFGDIIGMFFLYRVGLKILERAKGREDLISPLQLFCPHPLTRILFVLVISFFILPYLGVQISGVGKIFSSASGNALSATYASAFMLLIVSVYSLISGFRGIALTDTVQGILLLSVVAILGLTIVFKGFGGPVDMMANIQNTRPDLLVLPGPKSLFTVPFLLSGIILFASIPITQPQFLTRYLVIDSQDGQRQLKQISIGFATMIVVGTIFVLPIGLGGAVLAPDLKSGDLIVGEMLTRFLPDCLVALFMVGAMAAAMSTADSILFSTGQIFSSDVFRTVVKKDLSHESLRIPARIFMILVACIAFLLGTLNSDLIVSLSRLTFSGCLLLAPIVIFGLWKPARRKLVPTIAIGVSLIAYALFSSGLKVICYGFDPGIFAAAICCVVLSLAACRT